MARPYHELVEGRIYFGGAGDIQQIVDEEEIDMVLDLREEPKGCAASKTGLTWKRVPIGDNADQRTSRAA